jgi:diguanylate cyclase (GGDEF)-like protein
MRLSPEARLIAAFVACAAALIVTASLAIDRGRAYVEARHRIEMLLTSDAQTELSSTGADASRPTQSPSVRDRDEALRRAREAADRDLHDAEQASAALGALALTFFCVAYAAALHALRKFSEMRERLARESNHDPLTGLPNRRFFTEWLSYAIAHARRERGRVGVLFIDINGCDAVAELHGQRAVDAMLIEIARRFRAASREGEVFAQLGPTEFALATPNARDSRHLALAAQRLRDQLNESSEPPLADTPIGASIGIAFFPEDADDSAGIMAAANAAMYAARRAGRNHVAFHALAA